MRSMMDWLSVCVRVFDMFCVCMLVRFFLEVDGKFLKKSQWPFLLRFSSELISQLDRSWGALARNQFGDFDISTSFS